MCIFDNATNYGSGTIYGVLVLVNGIGESLREVVYCTSRHRNSKSSLLSRYDNE